MRHSLSRGAVTAKTVYFRPMTDLQLIPARGYLAARMSAGQHLKVINTYGQQVLDFWAFNAADLTDYMSMHHSHAALLRIIQSSTLNQRQPHQWSPPLSLLLQVSPSRTLLNRYVYLPWRSPTPCRTWQQPPTPGPNCAESCPTCHRLRLRFGELSGQAQ